MRQIVLLLIGAFALVGLARPAAGGELKGSEVFEHYCTRLLTQRTDLAPDYIEYIVRHGLKSMPPFAPSDLDETKLKALIAFLMKQDTAGK